MFHFSNVLLGQQLVDNLNKYQPIATFIPLDLSDLGSIKRFSDRLVGEKIDVLINNAGVLAGHFRMVKSTRIEEAMTVNYLGPFHLTMLLLPNLGMSDLTDNGGDLVTQNTAIDSNRIIFISSSLCKRGQLDTNNLDFSKLPYSPMQAYANSKLALCLFCRELHRRLHRSTGGSNPKINVITMFTGGMVNTGLGRHVISNYSVFLQPVLRFISWIFLKDPADMCHAVVHCALSNEFRESSGELYSDFKTVSWPARVNDSIDLCEDLWKKSCDIVGTKEEDVEKLLEKYSC